MALVKMTIQAYSDGKYTTKAGGPYTVFLNPESLTRSSTNEYSLPRKAGAAGESPGFRSAKQGTLTFSLLFDSTRAIDGNTIEVSTEIATLRAQMFAYQGQTHSPYYVEISWGTLLFKGRPTTFNVNYTLFRPDGSPVRAKVDLAFISYTDPEDLAQQANNQSADLSHHHVVQAGDTLPLLCHRIYGEAGYYLQVAQRNGLVHFNRLVPGTVLLFPPLRS